MAAKSQTWIFLLSMHWADVNGIYRRCRYKFSYYLIDIRRKYYSNSRNPRVIHTKLKDQILISLRTCPNDKYLTKPDEYLTLAKDFDTESLVDMYLEDLIALVNLGEATPLEEIIDDPGEVLRATTPQTLQTSPICQSEAEEINSISQVMAENAYNRGRMRNVSDIQKVWARLPFSKHSLVSENVVISSTDESGEALHPSFCPPICKSRQLVWNSALNDVLGAKRATSSDKSTKDFYEATIGEIMHNEGKGVDLFAYNLVDGRAKFYGKS